MKRFTLLLILALCAANAPAQVDITFRVDMSGLTISPDGVHVAGDLNGWSTTDNQLTDQGDSIYMATVSLEPGRDIQYKYLNGNAWGTEEAAPGNCTVGGNNRIFTVAATADTLDLVPFNSCAAMVEKKHVIFQVDMSNETPSGDGIHVAGNFVAWDPGVATMTDLGNGIYEYRADVLASILTLQYKYVNGNAWGGEEGIPEGCKNGDNNRFLALSGDTVVLPTYVFGSCDTTAKSSSTNIDALLAAEEYQLLLDPVQQGLALSLDGKLGETQLRILDMQGRTLIHQRFRAVTGQVDFALSWSELPAGVYLLHAETQKGLISRRFLVSQ